MIDIESQFSGIVIDNPKAYADSVVQQESRFFPYYAGYSSSFTTNLLSSLCLPKDAFVLDPWNGSGTTTLSAVQLGFSALGQDLNPVMVLVAKAGLLPKSEASSLVPLAKSILEGLAHPLDDEIPNDPLNSWFSPTNAKFVRLLESKINRSLVSHESYTHLSKKASLSTTSSLAAFFYVSLFKATRRLLKDFVPTNPTWVKTPSSPLHRRRPTDQKIRDAFLAEVISLSSRLSADMKDSNRESRGTIILGNAESISLPSYAVDAVVTSPPYCTRIDYAVATSIELAVLRSSSSETDAIRRSLMGSSTVPSHVLSVSTKWGKTCESFLEQVFNHPSKASKTYYFKNHLQYFNSLKKSIDEIGRVLKCNGKCVMVVQDSYYKEIKNDVAGIAIEMAQDAGLSLGMRKDFNAKWSIVGINTRARGYVNKRTNVESVLCFVSV